jgi:hypothetical protein
MPKKKIFSEEIPSQQKTYMPKKKIFSEEIPSKQKTYMPVKKIFSEEIPSKQKIHMCQKKKIFSQEIPSEQQKKDYVLYFLNANVRPGLGIPFSGSFLSGSRLTGGTQPGLYESYKLYLKSVKLKMNSRLTLKAFSKTLKGLIVDLEWSQVVKISPTKANRGTFYSNLQLLDTGAVYSKRVRKPKTPKAF